MIGDNRGRVHLPDAIIGVAVFVAIVVLSPVIMDLTGDIDADPFSALMLQLVVPALFLGLIISIGISAMRFD